MLNAKGQRELSYLVKIEKIEPIVGSDNCEAAYVGGWHIMVHKNEFKVGDPAVYFEIDSHLDYTKPEYAFLEKKRGNIKTQKYTFGGKGNFISQGLLMPLSAWIDKEDRVPTWLAALNTAIITNGLEAILESETKFLTQALDVTYADPNDNMRKAPSMDKYKKMSQRHPNIFKRKWARWFMRRRWGRKLMFLIFGKKKDNKHGWPVGKFPGVSKTDQERVECMTWVLNDKTPFIRTQKCDGSSGTFILEKRPFGKYEFYVCSRNVRMLNDKQDCFYGDHNYYWEVVKKYNIEEKMKQYLATDKDLKWVCWQGEICAPGIQSNPHGLTETHFYCFHMTDNKMGRFDIRRAAEIWKEYEMEVVPIDKEEYILPDDFEEFKLTADGVYDASVCEGKSKQVREGYVYYKTTDPTFSFKNVSREYLLKH